MTSLDFVGVYDPVTRLKMMGFMPRLRWDVCAPSAQVKDQTGLRVVPRIVGKNLGKYDIIIVPGGPGTRKLIHDRRFLKWLRTARTCPLKVSVCTGALLLGAAGFLRGKKATTHHSAFHMLRRFCSAVVEDERIVDEGDVVTAGGVTSSLDMGLYLCERLAGKRARLEIGRQIEYRDFPEVPRGHS